MQDEDLKEIELKIIALLADFLSDDSPTVTGDTRLTEDLEMDSLDILDFFVMIEDYFAISIDLSEIDDLNTVSDIVKYLSTNNYF
jgi:acyl carrier protein